MRLVFKGFCRLNEPALKIYVSFTSGRFWPGGLLVSSQRTATGGEALTACRQNPERKKQHKYSVPSRFVSFSSRKRRPSAMGGGRKNSLWVGCNNDSNAKLITK